MSGDPHSGSMLAGRPDEPVEIPDVVTRRAAGRPVEAVWRNDLGGLTFRLGGAVAEEYVKWLPTGTEADLSREARKLAWAVQFAIVPRVVDCGHDDEGQWLVTTAVPGTNAVEERWRADPASTVATIGRGLRAWHDAMPVARCPFAWTAASRLAAVRRREADGRLDLAPATADFGVASVEELFDELARTPTEDLVVCHGDACAPNTLLDDDGHCSGHVDLGQLGVGDRWADIAVAAWSTVWNYGAGHEEALYRAYGVDPDEERIRYYRLLWDVG